MIDTDSADRERAYRTRFVVGSDLVAVHYDLEQKMFFARKDGEEWTVTPEQLVENYRPVSKLAVSYVQKARSLSTEK